MNENIRLPDPIIKETLLGQNNPIDNYITNNYYNNYNFEEDDDIFFEDILKQSKEEYDKEQLQRELQNELLEKQRLEKNKLCNSITQKINKIKGYDTPNKEVYETILSIIEMYEMEHIVNFVSQQEHHEKIFGILSLLRMTSDELQFLRNLIIL